VAAHLESEILIVDEVLAVGDAEFQKKCLGKMKDVSKGEGRTVLFVSHNMTAVNSLCTECVYMKNGSINSFGPTNDIVDEYLRNEYHSKTAIDFKKLKVIGDEVAILHAARIIDENGRKVEFSQLHQPIGIEFTYEVLKDGFCPVPNIHIFTSTGICAFISSDNIHKDLPRKGIHTATMWIPNDFLNDETYIVNIALTTMQPIKIHFYEQEALVFDVIEDLTLRQGDYSKKIHGVVRPKLNWTNNII
jgi:lipopolysaccharide transport system ATP-binding protein